MWLLLLLLLLLVSTAWGATPTSLTVSWDAPTTNDCTGQPTEPCPTCTPIIVPWGTQWCPTADPCVMACDPVAPLTDLAGYRLYFGGAPCPSPQHATVGNVTSVIVTGLMPSTTYTAQVTAVDTSGNESVCTPPATGRTMEPVPPGNVTHVVLHMVDAPAFLATPSTVTFAWTIGQPLPAPQTVAISGGTGSWYTQDTNPWADVTGGTWNPGLGRMDFPDTATSFTLVPSSGMLSLAAGTHTQTILVTRGALTTIVTVRVVVT